MTNEIDYRSVLDHTEENALVLKMKGFTHQEIAKAMDVSDQMISTYLKRAKMKLHANNYAQAAARYLGWRGLYDD